MLETLVTVLILVILVQLLLLIILMTLVTLVTLDIYASYTGITSNTGYTGDPDFTGYTVFSPCGTLLGNVHEAHVMVLGGPVVGVTLVLDAGQTRLLHAGLLPQEGASGGSRTSSGSSAPSGPRS